VDHLHRKEDLVGQSAQVLLQLNRTKRVGDRVTASQVARPHHVVEDLPHVEVDQGVRSVAGNRTLPAPNPGAEYREALSSVEKTLEAHRLESEEDLGQCLLKGTDRVLRLADKAGVHHHLHQREGDLDHLYQGERVRGRPNQEEEVLGPLN